MHGQRNIKSVFFVQLHPYFLAQVIIIIIIIIAL